MTALALIPSAELAPHFAVDAGAHPGESLRAALLALWNGLESADSRRGYRDDWRRWAAWCSREGISVLSVRALHVQCYLKHLFDAGKRKSTRQRALSVIRQTYATIVVADLMPSNPAREVKNFRLDTEPKTPWLTEDELRMLLRAPKDGTWVEQRDWLIAITLWGTSLRRSEVARLGWGSLVAEEAGTATLKVRVKGGKEAFVVLPRWLWAELRNSCPPEGGFFRRSKRSGEQVSASTVRNAVKRLAARAGLPADRCTPHAIRRSFATIGGKRGASLRDRQVAMNHARQSTTERYDHAVRLPEKVPGELLGDLVTGSSRESPACAAARG